MSTEDKPVAAFMVCLQAGRFPPNDKVSFIRDATGCEITSEVRNTFTAAALILTQADDSLTRGNVVNVGCSDGLLVRKWTLC